MLKKIFFLFIILLNYPFLFSDSDYNRISIDVNSDYDFTEVNHYEKSNNYRLADSIYDSYQDDDFLDFFSKERKILRNSDFSWSKDNIDELVNMIMDYFNSYEIDLPPTLFCHLYPSGMPIALSKEDFIKLIGQRADVFIVDRTERLTTVMFSGIDSKLDWAKDFESVLIFIEIIENSIYPKVNEHFEITGGELISFRVEKEEASSFSSLGIGMGIDATKALVYGISDTFPSEYTEYK